ncbi:hypothetical protein T4B_171 [Trichinella pseudospiralis]|uniref:Uncharacterized protein n=1 Tax=Trichinella pseudospiralis TaxID=6337 RepID=A0A0V1IDX6_TRIPS|nr:hypothetical protein T4A_4388 [Trichinella pseudospiralis]KRZ20995.1 hypothetical protein T4B_171 [Trichinella pseudospiralis]KRZ28023.1 hypothetical protein T4C_10377 [Trichinella pseudospiralis]
MDWNFHPFSSFRPKFGLRINHSISVDSQRNANESEVLKSDCDMLVQKCRHLRTANKFLNTKIKNLCFHP